MIFEHDPDKDAGNRVKHGVSLFEAANIDWSKVIYAEDCRYNYGEIRYEGFGPIDGRLYCVVFTQRGDILRIVSLRKANKREVRDYAA